MVERLEKVWNAANEDQAIEEMISASNNGRRGYSAFHVCAKNGNFIVLQWYLKKLED